MQELKVGAKATRQKKVTRDMLATSVGSGSVEVLATPMVAALMEGAAADLAQSGLEDVYTTVGTKLNIEHLNPTALGMTVTAEAELTSVEGRVFRFAVRAYDEGGLVAAGEHERVSIKREGFAEKAARRGRDGE
ncbi:MAG: thioesterase [Clostridiales bacterium]|jgi:fluoroacetyl-CoA thioesterase|nr:thioesterase [Clostridiales bacterium]